jgi:hypothetical protein
VETISHKVGALRRVDVVAGPERTYKLRFATNAEGSHWMQQLLVWKQHFAP